ncbi:MAG: tetratricopeptide repeat protein [Treponemataceae bacterium]|nr:MAG: tetratricopeptide repeat protein [Treponemataceae bacterium]
MLRQNQPRVFACENSLQQGCCLVLFAVLRYTSVNMVYEAVEVLNTRAIEFAALGQFTEAIACFERAITMENQNYLLWYNLGVTYRNLGNFDAARKMLEHADKIAPYDDTSDDAIIETLSMVCFAQGDMQSAFNYCMRGIELNECNPNFWNNAGVLFFNSQDFLQAEHAFENAVSLNPYFYDALFNLRDTYAELGDKKAADECARRLTELDPDGERGAE